MMSKTFRYQIAILGKPWFSDTDILNIINESIDGLGIDRDSFRFLSDSDVDQRDRKAPFVAIFFGYRGAHDSDHPELKSIREDSLPILPTVNDLQTFRDHVPASLDGINGIRSETTSDLKRMVSIIFQNLRLLRRERRVFISYRRVESTAIAIQMYEALDSKGFDVFLDTHSVPPGEEFQPELWHRLADSDIVLLLDTPDFRVSKWTVKELARANSTNIQILHVLWPNVSDDPGSAFSQFYPLKNKNFRDGEKPDSKSTLSDATVDALCGEVESLRARAMSARYAYLVDSFCDLARDNGRNVDVNPERYISVSGGEMNHSVFPAIGVPNSNILEEVEAEHKKLGRQENICVIYDERGILDKWRGHLDWLNNHLPLKTVQVGKLPEAFAKGEL